MAWGHAAIRWRCIDCSLYFSDIRQSDAHFKQTKHTIGVVTIPEHNAWLKEELPMPTDRKTMLIRKAARQFRTGEVLYLFGCDTGDLYGVLRGAFVITEVKHQSDTGVSFFLRHQFIDSDHPWSGPKRSYLVEFARGQKLYRLAGTPVSFVIEEPP